MNECFDKYEITDEFVRMTYFVKGLRSEIKTQLLKHRPNTLNECEEYAQIIESADQQSSSLADAVSKLSLTSEPKRDTAKNQSNNPFCRFCGAKHKFGQHLRSFQRPQNRFRGGGTLCPHKVPDSPIDPDTVVHCHTDRARHFSPILALPRGPGLSIKA